MPKLINLVVHARGDPIIMLLKHAKVDFELDAMSFEQFFERKKAGDFPAGQVPCYITDEGLCLN